MPPQTQDVSGDQDFKNLSLSDKYAYLNDTDQDFKGLSSSDQQAYLAHVAGSEPTPQPKMQTSSLPGIVRGAMSTLPAMGALAGGALSSPGLLTTPAGGAAGMGAGRAAELGINRSIFGSGEENPLSSEGMKDIGLNAGMGAAMDLPAGILAKVEGVGRYIPLARKMAGEYIGKKSQTLGDIVAGGEGPKPFGRTTAPVIDQAGIPRIGNQAPEVQMVPPRMRTLPKVAAPTPFGGVEAPTPQASIPRAAANPLQDMATRQAAAAPVPEVTPTPFGSITLPSRVAGIPKISANPLEDIASRQAAATPAPQSEPFQPFKATRKEPGLPGTYDPLQGTASGGAPTRAPTPGFKVTSSKLPQVFHIPEPNPVAPGEVEGYLSSIPRKQIPGLAQSGREGAGKLLRNLGKTVIYTPRGSS
jgi:hypothetical protein